MSKDWNEEELAAASEAMKAAGHLGYEEFCEELEKNGLAEKDIVKDAISKIADELKHFKGGNKEKAVSTFVASTLTHFCEQDERYAKAVLFTTRTLSECCAEIMKGCGNAISDIDVYRAAVKHYFPNSEVHMTMSIEINGDEPTNEELTRKADVKPVDSTPKKKKEKAEGEKVEKSSPVAYPVPDPEPEPKSEPEIMQLTLF